MSEQYEPNSTNAVLSRIETKLNAALETQQEHSSDIRKLWAALGKMDVRVAVISGGIGVTVAILKVLFFNHN